MKTKQEILKLLGGIPEDVYDSICSSFFSEAKTKVEGMAEAIAASDFLVIAQQAHAIKGSASNLHQDAIAEAAKSIEAAAKGQDMAKVQQCFLILKSAFQ